MKIFRLLFAAGLISCCMMHASSMLDAESVCSKSYSLLLGILEKGVVHLELHSLPLGVRLSLRDCYAGESVFCLDLNDHEGVYNVMSCDQSTEGAVVIRSCNDAMYDYCLNWGPMLGINICPDGFIAYLNVAIEKQEQGCCYIAFEGEVENTPVNFRMYVDKDVVASCACVISQECADGIKVHSECMALTDACKLGVITTISRHQPVDSHCDFESELEFDRIIDSMMQDGTIKIKEDSPWMIRLKTIGSSLFVNYLAIKSYIAKKWHCIVGNESLTVQETVNTHQ